MPSIIRFVDSITSNPQLRLDLNVAPWMVAKEGFDMSPPDMKYTKIDTFIGRDGDAITSSSPANRLIKIPLVLVRTPSAEMAADAIRDLHIELTRDEGNVLMVQLDGMAKPVFFLTYPCDYTLKTLRLLLAANTQVTVEIPAQPYGYGPRINLSSKTIFNSYARGPSATINGDFESDVSGWAIVGGAGTTLTRSTSQFHAGVASAVITPNGTDVTCRAQLTTSIAASAGQYWRTFAWLRCAVARTVHLQLGFFDGGGSLIGSYNDLPIAVSAGAWTYFDVSGLAPANTATVRTAVMEDGTPGGTNFLYFDEVKLMQKQIDGSLYHDITGVIGDTDTPLFLQVQDSMSTGNVGHKRTLIAMRKGGNPANVPFQIYPSDLSLGTDATLAPSQPFDASGSGHVTVGYGTQTGMVRRMYLPAWPPVWSSDLRGSYDVYVRVRTDNITAIHNMRFGYGTSTTNRFYGPTIGVPLCGVTPINFYCYIGNLMFPAGFDPGTEGYSNVSIDAAQVYFELQTQRVSGTGNLYVDAINLVPVDDEACIIEWPDEATCDYYQVDGRRNAVYGLDTTNNRIMPVGPIPLAGAVPMLRPGVTNRLFLWRDIGSGQGSTMQAGSVGDLPNESTFIIPFYYPRYFMIRQATT